MKVVSSVRLTRFLLLTLFLSLVAGSTNYAGAITAASTNTKDPTGSTYAGKGSSPVLDTSKKEAKKGSRASAEKACKKFCDDQNLLVCASVIEEPGDPHCSNMGTSAKPKYECTLSSTAGDAYHGCKLTTCTCCSFSEGEPLF